MNLFDDADRSDAGEWIDLCAASDVRPGEATTVMVRDLPYAVCNDRGRYAVVDNTCPHAGGSLGSGYVADGHVVCPWHHWPWHLETGKTADELPMKIRVYETRVENGRVLARIPKDEGDRLTPDETDLDARS